MNTPNYPVLREARGPLRKARGLIAILGILVLPATNLPAERTALDPIYLEKDGVVVMEMEHTASARGQWILETDIAGFSGDGYLRFDGNRFTSGPPGSPLVFRFKIQTPGTYQLHLRCAKEIIDDRTDVANDAYVRVEGDYTALDGPHSSHGDVASLETLKSDTKFYGGEPLAFAWAAGNRLDLGGHQNKRRALYSFKADTTYTLVISGRSRHFRIDRVLFCHDSVDTEYAHNPQLPESKSLQP